MTVAMAGQPRFPRRTATGPLDRKGDVTNAIRRRLFGMRLQSDLSRGKHSVAQTVAFCFRKLRDAIWSGLAGQTFSISEDYLI